MIPGINILNLALSVIGRQFFDYYAYVSRTPNENGIDVTNYALPLNMSGSAQPVPRHLYAEYGLDWQKNYWTFYVSIDVIDVNRDVSGDQFFFNGKVFQCESITPWFQIDGWTAVLCIEVPNA